MSTVKKFVKELSGSHKPTDFPVLVTSPIAMFSNRSLAIVNVAHNI